MNTTTDHNDMYQKIKEDTAFVGVQTLKKVYSCSQKACKTFVFLSTGRFF